jgi:hypothetical protein
MAYSDHDLSNVPLFINELGTRGNCSYQVGQKVIIMYSVCIVVVVVVGTSLGALFGMRISQ